MKTACFKNISPQMSGLISIARWAPRGYEKVPRYTTLCPPIELLARKREIDGLSYEAEYFKIVLSKLDLFLTKSALERSVHPYEPILMCWEELEVEGAWCHRRMVARWFEKKLGIEVEEVKKGLMRSEVNVKKEKVVQCEHHFSQFCMFKNDKGATMSKSSIEWTEETWNPVTGCTKVSAGCKNCYAEVMTRRLQSMGTEKYRNGFSIVTTHEGTLGLPLTWKKPKKAFVNSMSDLFHKDVSFEFIQRVFEVMNETPQHTYQVLTKRSDRLLELALHLNWTPNVWMGVSVENKAVTHRIGDLVKTPAKVKFLSVEPLIGEINPLPLEGIDWVIVGGESGPKARPIREEWVEFIINECQKRGVAYFFKQWGKPEFNPDPGDETLHPGHKNHVKGGCKFKGQIHQSIPVFDA